MVNIMLSRSFIDNPYLFLYFKKYIKPGMNVLVIPWSFYPGDDYNTYRPLGERYERLVNQFIPYRINEENINWLDYYEDNHEIAIEKIKKADVIYLTGGLPDKFFQRICEFEINEALENFKGVMVGISAGAVIQFQTYHLSPDRDYKKFNIYPGLKIINDFGVEVHYGDRTFRQNRSLKKINKILPRTYYEIPNAGALIKDGEKIILINGSKKHYFK